MIKQEETETSGNENPPRALPGNVDRADDVLLLPTEAAEHLRISVATLLRLSRNEEIPGVRVGKLWRYHKSSLDEWVRSKVNSFRHPCRK